MSWLGLDDGILDHPKFIRAVNMSGSEAIHLWLGLRAYCGKHLTDGFIPADMVDEVRGPKGKARERVLATLVHVGLLEQSGPGGYQMHDYLDWSESRDDIIRKRERARERQAKSRGMSQRDSTVTHGEVREQSQSPLLSSPILSKSDPPVGPPSGDAPAAPSPSPPRGDRRKVPKPVKWARFPQDWVITAACRQLALELGVSAEREHQKILDHEFKTPRSDPEATFRQWLRRSAEMASERRPGGAHGFEQHNLHKQQAGADLARRLLQGGK
jgi:hypothetical protein